MQLVIVKAIPIKLTVKHELSSYWSSDDNNLGKHVCFKNEGLLPRRSVHCSRQISSIQWLIPSTIPRRLVGRSLEENVLCILNLIAHAVLVAKKTSKALQANIRNNASSLSYYTQQSPSSNHQQALYLSISLLSTPFSKPICG